MAYNSFINKQVGTQSPKFEFKKDRNNATIVSGDGLGEFNFLGFDGTAYLTTSKIISTSSGTIAANRIGSNLEFYTHPDSTSPSNQCMVIENTGQVQINNPSSNIASLFVTNNQSTPNINLRTANATATNAPHIHFTRSRAGSADAVANDELGRLEYFGFQGGTAREAGEITAVAETVNGTNGVSSYLSFRTVPTSYAASAERMRISADGNISISNPVSGVALNIVGGGQTVIGDVNLNITGTANTNINSTSNSGTVSIGNTSSGVVTIDCGTAGITVGTTANAHSSTFGSTNSTSSTTIQSGSGALALTSTNGTWTGNSGTGTLALSNDASATTVNLATGAAVKTTTLGSTNSTSSTTVQSGTGALAITSTNGTLTANSGTGTLGISTDSSNTTVNLATGGAVKTVTLGSTNSTSSTTVQSGTGALNLTSTNGTWTGNSGTGTLSLSNDASATTVNLATGAAVKSVTLGSTNSTSSTTVRSGSGALALTSTNGTWTGNSGTGVLALSNDASATTVNLATGSAVKTTTLGSTNSTSSTTVQSGSGALNVTSTNGALTINSGTGTLALSNDASATTVNLATGAAVKTVQLGSTNTTSSLVLRSGTGNIVANTGLTVDSTGRMTNTAQPCFEAYVTANINNVTGDGTTYIPIFGTERIDQGNNYDTATGTFTAPKTGVYCFNLEIFYDQLTAAMTLGGSGFNVNGTNINQTLFNPNPVIGYGCCQSTLIWNLTAGDTVTGRFIIYLGPKQVDVSGGTNSNFGGYLIC